MVLQQRSVGTIEFLTPVDQGRISGPLFFLGFPAATERFVVSELGVFLTLATADYEDHRVVDPRSHSSKAITHHPWFHAQENDIVITQHDCIGVHFHHLSGSHHLNSRCPHRLTVETRSLVFNP